jgi:hypothetical protein
MLMEATKNEGGSMASAVSIMSMDNQPFLRTVTSVAINGTQEAYEIRSGFRSDKMYVVTLRALSATGGARAALPIKALLVCVSHFPFPTERPALTIPSAPHPTQPSPP